MGPPISTWPTSAQRDIKVISGKCVVVNIVDNFRAVVGLNYTFVFILIQVLLSLVTASPVILSLDYLQGPVPLARNIRHLPCISRSTAQEGLCMFAIDCLKANGTHLGTCIDRFYFGSCCQILDKTTLPQIIGNNIEDNSIDSANFVHPLTEDKVHSTVSKIPEAVYPNKQQNENNKVKPINNNKTTSKLGSKPVTEAVSPQTSTEKTVTVEQRTEPNTMGTKLDKQTTLSNKIVYDNPKEVTVPVTSVKDTLTTVKQNEVTEMPIKLFTFQTVSNDIENISTERTEPPKQSSETTKTIEQVTTDKPVKTTRKPIKPTYKPRPTYRPSNFTRPTYISNKPRPTKPIIPLNTTRKPPYRLPPKRPSTKKPLPVPPRLNITVLPQSTSTRPVFTRPSVSTITYINTTSSVDEKPLSITITTTLQPSTTTVSTTTTTTTTTQMPTTTERVTERVTETTENIVTETSLPMSSYSTETVTEKEQTVTVKDNLPTTVKDKVTTTENIITTTDTPTETVPTAEPLKEIITEKDVLQELVTESVTMQDDFTEKETLKPVTEVEVPETAKPSSSTDFPPFVTWTNAVEVSKVPVTTTPTPEDVWSPITPPEGWILISTVQPKPDTTTSTTEQATITTQSTTTTTTTTTTEMPTTIVETSPVVETTKITTTVLAEQQTTISTTSTQTSPITDAPMPEFTVNVTLSPTVPTSTTSIGLTTFSSISSANVTEASNKTESSTDGWTGIEDQTTQSANETSTEPPTTVSTSTVSTTTESYNMSNYKEVCGRRMWPQARIVGGAMSGFGQWPWQISLRQFRTSTYLHKCGAALLNENWAITAAHCVERVPPSDLLVRLGEYDLANEEEPYGFAERRVQIVASHPHFDPATFEYDLALLRFYEPVTFQPNILPVCVPDNDDTYVGRTAHVTGWGRLYDEGPLPSVLQEVEVPVINNTACEAMYLAAGYNEHIPNIFICAGWRQGGSDSCEGDSGGPMVVQRERDNRFVLSGVISWGIGCAEPNQPGVYTRISEFRDWINQILQF
ncbi:serine proteinase stubble [Pararge aegeria]|uniref:serine proteinase stubble n=1 Tax=Pararge aegeria TaxID=116150 RepID=UPI0019D31B4C|nr:serine proteinase stubble [Pararge aegeria]